MAESQRIGVACPDCDGQFKVKFPDVPTHWSARGARPFPVECRNHDCDWSETMYVAGGAR